MKLLKTKKAKEKIKNIKICSKEYKKVKKEQKSLKNLLINQGEQGANKNRATTGK